MGRGRDGPVEALYSVIRRRASPPVVDMVEGRAPESFVVVEEPRAVRGGRLHQRQGKWGKQGAELHPKS